MGVVCCAGENVDDFYNNVFSHNTSLFTENNELSSGRLKKVGKIKFPLPDFPHSQKQFLTRTNHLAFAAIKQFENAVEDVKSRYEPSRIGVIAGTCTAGSSEVDYSRRYEDEHGHIPEGYDYSLDFMDNVSEFIKIYLDIKGPAISVSTACTSSGKAIAMAKRYVEQGFLDAVIVGGSDSFALTTLNGFDSLSALSASDCQPFSADRDGINLGEGAAFFLVSREQSNITLLGAGESSDGYHMSSPHPEGIGAEEAVRQSLSQAGLEPKDIAYINMHGTGTEANDSMESTLVNRVFGADIPCSTIKNIVGHTLGAASAVELCLCIAVLKKGKDQFRIIPQYRHYDMDPKLPKINLAAQNQYCTGSIFLSTSYAFGGSNCSLVVGLEK